MYGIGYTNEPHDVGVECKSPETPVLQLSQGESTTSPQNPCLVAMPFCLLFCNAEYVLGTQQKQAGLTDAN